MLELLFKSSFRNLLKNKSLTLINVLGLSVGITCSIIIYLIIRYENSFDKYHSQLDNIYHLYTDTSNGQEKGNNSGVPYPLHEAIEAEIPGIKTLAELYSLNNVSIKVPGNNDSNFEGETFNNDLAGVEPSYFEIFDWEWMAGAPTSSFEKKESVVLTEKTALNIFGTLDVIGKDLLIDKEYFVTVTGLLKNPAGPSNFEFSVFVPIELIISDTKKSAHWNSVSSNYQNYILVEGDEKELKQKVLELKEQIGGLYKDKNKESEAEWKISMQPLSEMHFNTSMYPNTGTNANAEILMYLLVIALVMILSACINYINLSTAFSVLRSSEIGVRKVLGSSKRLLILQFLTETFMLVSISVIISFCLTELFLMNMNFFIDWNIQDNLFRNALQNDILIYLFLPVLALIIALLSGIYPAFITSSYNPIHAIKNKINFKGNRGFSMRRALVLIQFSLCQVFIFGTLVVMEQLEYARTNDLGFDRDHIVNINLPWKELDKKDILRNEWNTVNGISKLCYSNQAPITGGWMSTTITFENDSSSEEKSTNLIEAEPGFFDIYQFSFLAGEPFPKSDTLESIVINQKFLSMMGLSNPYDAVGREVFYNKDYPLTITGVVSDFHLNPFKTEIKPLMIGMRKKYLDVANLKIDPLRQQEILANLESKWKIVYPDEPFKYNFLEDNIYKLYKTEEQTYRMFNLFAGIAIFISCLGLYGLVAFMSLQKKKEIGIRKVLGASITQIIYLFSKEFILLILAALLLAGPLGFYMMNSWLKDYVYRINITWDLFAITLCIAMLIALITVGYQSTKSALRNPAESLKSE